MREKAITMYHGAVLSMTVFFISSITFIVTATIGAQTAMIASLIVLTFFLSCCSGFIAMYIYYDHKASREEQNNPDIPA